MNANQTRTTRGDDSGSVLPIVLVITVVLGMVVAALATYSATTLRYGRVVEDSADRLATANAAIDNALEALVRSQSPCSLTALGSSGGTYTYTLNDTLNGISPTVTCSEVGGEVGSVDAFAVILTGEGIGCSTWLFDAQNNQVKNVNGPVYVARTASAINATHPTLDIADGDVWYSNVSCPAGVSSPCDGTLVLPANVRIISEGYDKKCLEQPWKQLFLSRKPPVPSGLTSTPRAATSGTDVNGCTEWEPGHYATLPNLSDEGNEAHYFKSGVYYFSSGTWSIDKEFVLMGRVGDTAPSTIGTSWPGHACYDAWNDDTNHDGAVLYLGGNARIVQTSQGPDGSQLEITGRQSGDYRVSAQALKCDLPLYCDPGTPSSVSGFILNASGNPLEIAMHGLVWAPYSSIRLDDKNKGGPAFRGGLVVARAEVLTIPAGLNSFVMSVETQPKTTDLLITARAVNGGTTEVQARLKFRTDGHYELLSRRVVGLTPE